LARHYGAERSAPHFVENVGNTALHIIAIEIKV